MEWWNTQWNGALAAIPGTIQLNFKTPLVVQQQKYGAACIKLESQYICCSDFTTIVCQVEGRSEIACSSHVIVLP